MHEKDYKTERIVYLYTSVFFFQMGPGTLIIVPLNCSYSLYLGVES